MLLVRHTHIFPRNSLRLDSVEFGMEFMAQREIVIVRYGHWAWIFVLQ